MSEPGKGSGLFLLFTGWLLVLAAIVMLHGGASQAIFALAGFAIQVAGLIMLCRYHLLAKERVG